MSEVPTATSLTEGKVGIRIAGAELTVDGAFLYEVTVPSGYMLGKIPLDLADALVAAAFKAGESAQQQEAARVAEENGRLRSALDLAVSITKQIVPLMEVIPDSHVWNRAFLAQDILKFDAALSSEPSATPEPSTYEEVECPGCVIARGMAALSAGFAWGATANNWKPKPDCSCNGTGVLYRKVSASPGERSAPMEAKTPQTLEGGGD